MVPLTSKAPDHAGVADRQWKYGKVVEISYT